MTQKEKERILLVNKLIKSEAEIFDPKEEKYFQELEIFFQGYIKDKIYDFENPIFFWGSEKKRNAWAWNKNGINAICINKYAIDEFRAILIANRELIFDIYTRHNITRVFDNELPGIQLMEDSVTTFLFYHEAAHLIQAKDPFLSSYYVDEIPKKGEFNIVDHVSEYDADRYASHMYCAHIEKMYSRQKGLKWNWMKAKHLEDLCIVIISSYLTYRMMGFTAFDRFYLREETHPHLLVRMTALIINVTSGTIERTPIELNRNRILHKAIDCTEEFSKLLGVLNSFSTFFRMGQDMQEEIGAYIFELESLMNQLTGTAKKKIEQANENN